MSSKKQKIKKLPFFGVVFFLAAGLIFGLFTGESAAGKTKQKKDLILHVDKVELEMLPAKKPMLHITAHGKVGSTGWTEPELVLVQKDCPKSFKCFEFRAKEPSGIVPQVITPISAGYILEEFEHIRKIKVISRTNSITVGIEKVREKPGFICIGGKLTEEGVECQAMRGNDGKLYTLIGDLKGFKPSDTVYVVGIIPQFSICMQGTTISVCWIGKEKPMCKW